jgi:hypothetical protein
VALAVATNVATGESLPTWLLWLRPASHAWVAVAVLGVATVALAAAATRDAGDPDEDRSGMVRHPPDGINITGDHATVTATTSRPAEQTVGTISGGKVSGPVYAPHGTVINVLGNMIHLAGPPSVSAPAAYGSDAPVSEPDPDPPERQRAFTGRWQPMTNLISAGPLMRLKDNQPDHPAAHARAASRHEAPPTVRVGVVMACANLPATTPATSDLRAWFLRFLAEPAVMSVVVSVTSVDAQAVWTPSPGHGRHSLYADLTRPDDPAATPVAWARLNMPTPDPVGLHDARCVEFVLSIERRAPDGRDASALPLDVWPDRFTRLLAIPIALAAFLEGDLRLATTADPATQVGIFLHGPATMTDLVNVDGFTLLSRGRNTPWYDGYAVADPGGGLPAATADELIRQLCDLTLGLDNYERVLRTAPDTGKNDEHLNAAPVSRRDRLHRLFKPLLEHAETLLAVAGDRIALFGDDTIAARDERHHRALADCERRVRDVYTDALMESGTDDVTSAYEAVRHAADRYVRSQNTNAQFHGTVSLADLNRQFHEIEAAATHLRTQIREQLA